MDDYFASISINNSTVVCVGGRSEAEAAYDDGCKIDGFRYYLFLARESCPREPIEILAKFVSESQAAWFAEIIERAA